MSLNSLSLKVVLAACFAAAAVSAGEVPVPVPVPVPPKADAKAKDDKPKDDKPKEDKAKGPEHNVSLNEESGVVDLLNKARKAREKAETDPQLWPECVKHYADILKKYPNSVYLDKWEGPDKKEMWFKNGLYKSTRERVAQEIATLPPNGLAIYRVINDPAARALFQDAQEQFDERKMEQVARDYYSTSWGDDALAWLGELACDRGAYRQALMRMAQVLKHPTPSVPKLATLQRMFLAQVRSVDRAAAEKTLKEIEAAAGDPQNGKLRLGHAEGPAVLEKLKAQLAAIEKGGSTGTAGDQPVFWETYLGNAQHNLLLPPRKHVGIKKWSLPIRHLLYGPTVELSEGESVTGPDGQQETVQTMNHHIISREGYFYLCDGNAIVAYPVGNPKPGPASAGGNARFTWPTDLDSIKPRAQPKPQRGGWGGEWRSVRYHPFFCTIANQRLYAVCGGEPPGGEMQGWGRQGEQKIKPNYLIALGRQGAAGTLESGKLVWSLQPDSPAFSSHSKTDQEWLRSVYFVTAPTYDAGALYLVAVLPSGSHEAWLASFDADTGHLLWRTSLCSSSPYQTFRVQPDLALAPTVAGGVVYVGTNLGGVAAVDAVSGGIKWLRIYDRVKIQANNPWGVDRRQGQADFWAPNPPMIHENILIVTPQDSELLYAYDIESGRRLWEVPRSGGGEGEGDSLKHVLGITHNTLVVTGEKQVHFFNIKSGRRSGPLEPLPLKGNVRGRGAVTDGLVLVPTTETLERIETSLQEGRFQAKLLEPHVWENKLTDAGNVVVSGDILFTVSHKTVNAFFVFQEMEKRLRERLAAKPDDLLAFIELADIYQRIEQFDKAVTELENATAAAEKTKDDPKTAEALVTIRGRLIDSLQAMGERAQVQTGDVKPDLKAAYAHFKRAFDIARQPGMPREVAVNALRQMADNAVAREDLGTGVEHLQLLIETYGDVVYAFAQGGTRKARLYAEARIDELKKKDAKAYEKIEQQAVQAAEQAGDDAVKLQAAMARFPNSEAAGKTLLKLAQAVLEKEPDQARMYARRYLARFSTDIGLAEAIVAAAYERNGLFGPAYSHLQRLATQARFSGKTMPFDPADLASKPAAPLDVVDWAKKRLAHSQYLRPSQAVLAMGSGKLKQAWSVAAGDKGIPVNSTGIPPESMRKSLFYIINNELAVYSALNKGEEIWKPRPKTPQNCSGRALWLENLLILTGTQEIVAYDSRDNGRVVWRFNVPGGNAMPEVRANEAHLVILAQGVLVVLEAAGGNELWREQIEGAGTKGGPACGDSIVAVAGTTPAKLYIFSLENGKKRAATAPQSGEFVSGPLVLDDRVFIGEKNGLLCFDGATGKALWEEKVTGNITHLRGTRGLVLAVLNQREVLAYNIEGEGERKAWAALLPSAATVRDLRVDGDDLYVALDNQGAANRKSSLAAYSLKSQGKFLWDQELHLDPQSDPLAEYLVTTGHLVLVQNNWDLAQSRPTAIVLVDRKTGKLTWDANLTAEQAVMGGDGRQSFTFQTFDGGVVITEAKRRVAYLSESGNPDQTIKLMLDLLGKNPKDVDLRLRLAAARMEKGDSDAALNELSTLLAGELDELRFGEVYERLMLSRREAAAKQKLALTFAKLPKAPALDGTLTDWTSAPEVKLENWRSVLLPVEEDPKAAPKKGAWKNADDLSVSFRGGYDDKNLYLSIVVKDDKHKNDQHDPSYGDLGDSLRIFFDNNLDGGMGYRGEDFELGACVGKDNAPLGWKSVENGKYLSGAQKLESGIFAARKENEKQTVYQFALPLEYLKLKSEPGLKFGFSFAVNDQDEGTDVTKTMGPTPGVMRPTWPGLFAEGVLQGK